MLKNFFLEAYQEKPNMTISIIEKMKFILSKGSSLI